MEIIVKGDHKEIAALVLAVQERQIGGEDTYRIIVEHMNKRCRKCGAFGLLV